MSYVRAHQFPSFRSDDVMPGSGAGSNGSSAGPTMIDGLEVVDDEVVVLAPLEALARQPRHQVRRWRRDGMG